MKKYLFPLCLVLITGCSTSTYEAEISRTSYGIPHIVADSWGSLGFGEAYAASEDHFCTIMDQVIKVRSERARFFGAGPNNAHLDSDFALQAIGLRERAQDDVNDYPPFVQDYLSGYAAGINEYVTRVGVDAIPGWCQGASWISPVTALDIAAYTKSVLLIASRFTRQVANAQPPGELLMAGNEPFSFPSFEGASNGWALGNERTASGGGMLLSNPHYPWVGSNRFWEKHLTIPGIYDAYGVGLVGGMGVTMGFNQNVAWTHTVSSGVRYTLYELTLAEGNPTAYVYDGEPIPLQSKTVSIQVLKPDGELETINRDYFRTEYGPIVVLPGMEWSTEKAYALRDANADNEEAVLQWFAMGMANDMEAFQEEHATYAGMPWVNTIAASRDGRAWYADYASTPLLSEWAFEAWEERKQSNRLVAGAFQQGIILLDGSDSRFAWDRAPDARDQGVVPASRLPSLERQDYVFNANDSYWLANSSQLSTGNSPLHSLQDGTPRSPRTRMNDLVLSDESPEGPAGMDAKFTLDELAELALINRSLTAELLVDPLVTQCLESPMITIDERQVDMEEACRVLENWDQKYDLESRGAVLWREFILQFETSDLLEGGRLFESHFDPADPVGTPHTLEADALETYILPRLARAQQLLERAGLELDVPLGEVQYADRNGEQIPIHGGQGFWEGITNFVNYAPNSTTLEPDPEIPERVEGSNALRGGKYPINRGTSFIMVLDFEPEGPRARAIMTYGQSGDPESPHFSDQTRLFSSKTWRPILFDQADIMSDPNLRTYVVRQ